MFSGLLGASCLSIWWMGLLPKGFFGHVVLIFFFPLQLLPAL